MPRQTLCKTRACWLVLLVALLCDGGHAQAEVTGPAPVAQPSEDWPSLAGLLHLPEWMSLDLELTSGPMAGVNPTLNPAGTAVWMQQLTLNSTLSRGLSTPVETWKEFDHWALNLQLINFSGNPNLYIPLGAAFPLQNSAHPVGLWLGEASLQRRNSTNNLRFKAGLFSLNPSFVESPIFNAYVHSALNNTLNLALPGLPISPLIAPGAAMAWQLNQGNALNLGSYWLDSETALASMLGVNPEQPDVRGSLQIVQWTLSTLPGSQAMQQPIRTRQGAIARQLPNPLLQVGAFTTTAASTLVPPGSNQGIYGSLTLPGAVPVGLDNRFWVGFNVALNSATNPFPLAVMGGWLNQGLIPGRPFDVLALGIGRTSFSPQLSTGSAESVVELNYSINLNARFSLQPVIQWIINPGGGDAGSNAFAGGLQVNLNL